MLLIEPFLDKGYYVFMDNYYTSMGLFEELEGRKTLACGTVRSNRQGLPKDICDLKAKEVKSLKGGEPLYRQKDLEDSRQVKILKKTTTLLNLQNMFRQKLLSSSVDRFTKR